MTSFDSVYPVLQRQQHPGERTSHDITRVVATLRTIILCAAQELRRGLAAQRRLSVDQRCRAAVSTSACVTDAVSILHQSSQSIWTMDGQIYIMSPQICVCVCQHLCDHADVPALERRAVGGVGVEAQRYRKNNNNSYTKSWWTNIPHWISGVMTAEINVYVNHTAYPHDSSMIYYKCVFF